MSSNSQKMKIGIIGCGNISRAYFGGARNTDVLEIKSCADLQMEAAQQCAEQFGCQAVTVNQLLSDPDLRNQMGMAARRYAELNFHIEDVADRFQSVIEKSLKLSN